MRSARPLSLATRGVPVVTYALIGINVVVFAAVLVWPSLVQFFSLHQVNVCDFQGVPRIDMDHGLCRQVGGTWQPGTDGGGWWELLTSAFTHQQVWHIAGNMLSLWMIGPLLEAALGRVRYLVAYLICALGGSLLVLVATAHDTPTLGASGAIFGLMGILVVLFLRRGLPLQELGVVLAINFFITFTVSGISWQGHVGGFFTGLVIGLVLAYTPLGRRRI